MKGGEGLGRRYWGHKDGNGRLQDGGEDHEASEWGECWRWGCQRQPPYTESPTPNPIPKSLALGVNGG